MPDVVVIGAGISGLTCAWQIRRAGLEVVILEATHRPGGVIRSHRVDGYLVESGPNTILPTPESVEILSSAGLLEDLVEAPAKAPRFIYLNGRLHRVPWVLSARGLLRALKEPLVSVREAQTDESLASFFSRRFGPEVHDRLVAPFVSGIYAGDTARLSVQATFPRLKELEERYGSVVMGMLRGAMSTPRARLSSFRDGMESLPAALARNLDIRYGVDGLRLSLGWTVDSTAGRFEPKSVVLATSASVAANLVEPIDPDLSNALEIVDYAPIVVTAAAVNAASVRRVPHGFGFLVPRTEGLHTLGTLFSSSLFPNRAPDGWALLTSFLGGDLDRDVVDWPDTRIWETTEAELGNILGFTGGLTPLSLYRYGQAIPQYRLGHAAWRDNILRRIAERQGLFLAGNYLDGVSVPASMQRGRQSGDAAIEHVRRTS